MVTKGETRNEPRKNERIDLRMGIEEQKIKNKGEMLCTVKLVSINEVFGGPE